MQVVFFLIIFFLQTSKAAVSDFELINMRQILFSTISVLDKIQAGSTDYSDMQMVLFCFTTII